MNLGEYYAEDLHELVEQFDQRDVFRPGEREAWEEEINDAEDDYQSLMYLNESLLEAIDDRDGVKEVVDNHTHPETKQFV
ncbi:hypothetical protein GJ633_04005 [Halorubrum sp. CBA1125]|uniref:hypothetical protein n=1 Tax=Halorubrum sp. CBA1125 TaxID=2668072 RepID=UPI0012E7B1DD|nr:hypothetical protein [Halorubrum sp. CBA1125]MUW13915.1 hypothetical protein [Halorubrum sp. CBA1125]